MANNFRGYLVKLGDHAIPNSLVTVYKSTPNQRMELSAKRDGNVLLHRETSPNYKTTATLGIRSMKEDEMLLFKSLLDGGIVNERERKYHITYWNIEEHDYSTGDFYIPDTQFQISYIDQDGQPWYDAFDLEFIEY